jgi:F-type H+-transporting ATPase subunit epsilon
MVDPTTPTGGGRLRCVVVTPERQVLDALADYVVVPMYDGELGVLPGRQALIGQLGFGGLRLKQGSAERHLYVDGGFAQVRADVITVLTPRAVPAAEIDVAAARRVTAGELPPGADDLEARTRELNRAQAQLRVVEAARRAGAGILERAAEEM